MSEVKLYLVTDNVIRDTSLATASRRAEEIARGEGMVGDLTVRMRPPDYKHGHEESTPSAIEPHKYYWTAIVEPKEREPDE